MEFVEASSFTKYLHDYFTDDEYLALQWYLATHPEAGDIIPGSGGLRKVRWSGKGRGKRGGTRIIYYYHVPEHSVWLLTLYAKGELENISQATLKALRRELPK